MSMSVAQRLDVGGIEGSTSAREVMNNSKAPEAAVVAVWICVFLPMVVKYMACRVVASQGSVKSDGIIIAMAVGKRRLSQK